MRILHLSLDEKFIDSAIEQFNLIQGVESVFCVKSDLDTLKYINSPGVRIIHTMEEIIDFANNGNFDYIIMHSLWMGPKWVASLKVPILWNSWGYDIYSDKSDIIAKPIHLSLYKPKTRKAAEKKAKTLHDRLVIFLRKFGILSQRQKRYNSIIKKIPYLSVVLPIEFDFIQKKCPHFNFFPFRYIDPSERIPFKAYTKTTTSILLGNSLDPTNNHIDILDIMEKRHIQCNVYIPISYPDNLDTYKKNLKAFASKLKYVNVRFIEDFIPKSEYFRIIDECCAAIFGHIRQQAIGNIFHFFYSGKKTLFYEDSVNYKYFQKESFKVFSIEHDLTQEIFSKPLSEDIQKYNHDLVCKDENYKSYMSQLQSFFDNLTKADC